MSFLGNGREIFLGRFLIAAGESYPDKEELKQRKEREHSQVRLLDLILIAINVSFGLLWLCCDISAPCSSCEV